MNTDKIAHLDPSPIIAACIIAAGLIVAATIDSHKFTQQTTGTANAQSAATVPSEASVRQQFMSQINMEYAGKTEEAFGRHQTYNRVDIIEIKFATKGDKINIVYGVYWDSGSRKGGSVDATGCTLTRDDYGNFTNANEISLGSAIQPHLDIQ